MDFQIGRAKASNLFDNRKNIYINLPGHGKRNNSHHNFSMKPNYSVYLKNTCGTATCALMALLGTLFGCVHAQAASTNASPVSSVVPAHPADSIPELLHESYQDFVKGGLDAALGKVNQAIELNSQNRDAFLLRASIYAEQKKWDKAEYDYDVALVIDPDSPIVKFDLAELAFMQKKYDDARPSFAELEQDKDLGDFATYKVFLCDLFGVHEAVAAKELDAFDQVGGNPSYYFANAAWDLVHNKPEDAADWLKSASRIYSDDPKKFQHYSSSLTDLGYLPLHLTSTQ